VASTFQSVGNTPLSSYPVAVAKLSDNAEVQSICAILPFISNQAVSGDFTYTGYAVRGSADSTASWFIIRDQASTLKRRFASDPFNFDQIWNNRASLTYT